MKELMENKKVKNATHNIQAYRIYREQSKTFDEHYEDDGEKQAGGRLLHLMQVSLQCCYRCGYLSCIFK